MEEDMIMNVPSAPEMQGTPMTPDLFMDMQSEMGDMTQNEIQEAQGALMQILQVINMLIEQGLNPEQIRAFLEQYGISEEELEQAAQALGVDIDMVLSGQMQAPQEPMMMANGGPSVNYMDIYNAFKDVDFASMDDIRRPGTPEDYDSKMFKLARAIMISDFDYKKDLEAGRNDSAAKRLVFINNMKKELQMLKNEYDNLFNPKSKKQNMMPPMMMAKGGPGVSQEQPQPQQLAFGMTNMSDNEPMMQDRSVGNQIFTLQSQINNLMNDYNIAIRDQDFNTAQAIADQINNIDVQITQLQSQMPMGLGEKKN